MASKKSEDTTFKDLVLSVLTEEKHFLGRLDYIKDIKDKLNIPSLAKDFFIEPYQIALTKSFGCDCILIIIAALDDKQADDIYAEALKHNLLFGLVY